MDILRQCAIWNENNEYQKIVDALEALPEEERSPETDSELACAYNNLADPEGPEGRDMLRKAIDLLEPHEEYFAGDHRWNFRMGYAYYYLDRPGRALPYFRAALKALPGDGDTEEFIARCEKEITLPRFHECFRERTKAAWDEFIRREAELRRLLDEGGEDKRSDLIEICGDVLRKAFYDISFELGKHGDRYELILMPERDKVRLFELVYFQKHAPARVTERWNILAGRRANPALALRATGGPEINGGDVRVWVERRGENGYALSAYCEKLPPRRSEDDARPEWMLWNLTDLILGEIFVMRNVCDFNVLDAPREDPSVLLSELPDRLKELGADPDGGPEDYLESYTAYKANPKEDPNAFWRLDVVAGSTRCPPLVNGYLSADDDSVDELEADGAAAGFLCYPLDTLREEEGSQKIFAFRLLRRLLRLHKEEEGSQKIFAFRDKLEEALNSGDGEEILAVTGGATGLYCGYVDFIAWDIVAALNKAAEFFRGTDIPWAAFHTFRREAGAVSLKKPEDGSG